MNNFLCDEEITIATFSTMMIMTKTKDMLIITMLSITSSLMQILVGLLLRENINLGFRHKISRNNNSFRQKAFVPLLEESYQKKCSLLRVVILASYELE